MKLQDRDCPISIFFIDEILFHISSQQKYHFLFIKLKKTLFWARQIINLNILKIFLTSWIFSKTNFNVLLKEECTDITDFVFNFMLKQCADSYWLITYMSLNVRLYFFRAKSNNSKPWTCHYHLNYTQAKVKIKHSYRNH